MEPGPLPIDSRRTETTANPEDTNHLPPPAIPDHQLLRRIGGGSYGDVWLGKNMMGAYRAIKIVYRKRFNHNAPFERELSGIRKFEPISRSHEGFVDILHVGINEQDGYFFYIMELGDDQSSGPNIDPQQYVPKTLSSEVESHLRLSAEACLELGLKLSSALQKLHSHGLVHRDVKPSNIIFVDGVPKLADIGLVTDIGGASSFVGTEGFIPPEGPGTPQADVYGLGKILYEASTGKDRQEFPRLPEDFDALPDKSLFLEINAVIVRACVGERRDRYQTAQEMHGDLELLAGGKSVKRLRLLERRFAQLKRLGIIVAVSGTIVGGITYHFYREWRMSFIEHQRQVGSDLAYGNAAMESGDLLKALPYFVDALRLDEKNSKAEPMHRLRIGSVLAQCPKLTRFWVGQTNLQHSEFSPDGKDVIVAQRDGPVEIYDVQTSKLCLHPFGDHCAFASYSRDGNLIVTAGRTVSLWNASTLESIDDLPHSNWVCSARFSPDGKWIVTACMDGFARVWNTATRELKRSIRCSESGVLFADFSHDGKMIVTCGYDDSAAICDATNGKIVHLLSGHKKPVRYAAFSPDDTIVVTACEDHNARVFQVKGGARILPDLNHPDGVASVEFSSDGRLLVTASMDGTACLWETNGLKAMNPNPTLRHNERLGYAGFAPDGHQIVTCCTDGAVRLWDLAGSTVAEAPSRRTFSPDGSRFLFLTNSTVQIGSTTSDEPKVSLSQVEVPIIRADFNRNGRFVVVMSGQEVNPGATNYILQVRETTKGMPRGGNIVITNGATDLSLSDDGNYVVIFATNMAQIWNVAEAKPASPPLIHTQTVTAAAFAPGATQLATASGNQVELWSGGMGWAKTATLVHATTVLHIEYSPDGLRLLSCCSDTSFDKCYAQIWDAQTGKEVGPRLKHRDGVGFASFSPNGRFVATASEDFTAAIWNSEDGRRLGLVMRHGHQVCSVSFSPDSKWMVTASQDQTARVWETETGAPLTPSFRHLEELSEARFVSDGNKIITFGSQKTWIWKLPLDQSPLEDLRMLADLLSCGTAATSNPMEFPTTTSLLKEFQELQIKYPENFVATPEQIAAWQSFRARQVEFGKE
jgi:WD40 repeat protein/serine/threonine protein kinase